MAIIAMEVSDEMRFEEGSSSTINLHYSKQLQNLVDVGGVGGQPFFAISTN